MKKSALLFFLILLSSFTVKSQSVDSISVPTKDIFWMELYPIGLARASWIRNGDSNARYVLGAGLTWNRQHFSMKARMNYGFEIQILGVKHPAENIYELGLMAGRCSATRHTRTGFLCGIGIIGGTKREKELYSDNKMFGDSYYDESHYLALAVPLEISLMHISNSTLGLGLNFEGDISKYGLWWGVVFKLALGSFW